MVRAIAQFVLCLMLSTALWAAQDDVIEVYWKHTRNVAVEGAKHVEVFAESICKAELAGDQVRLVGLQRGETLVFVWVAERPLTWLVRVINEPENPQPRWLQAGRESSSHGMVSTSVQSAMGSNAPAGIVLFQRLQWQQDLDGNHLAVQGQSQNSNAPGAPAFNLTTASVQYRTPQTTLSAVDSIVNFNGGLRAQIVPSVSPTSLLLRGADLDLKRGANEFDLFAGVTLPAYFLNLSGTRELAGFNFIRSCGHGIDLYSTTAVAGVPIPGLAGSTPRRVTPFQTAGVTARLNDEWAVQLTGGASTRGLMAQGAVAYRGFHRSASASFTRAGLGFPLNQLQLLPAGSSAATAGASWQFTSKAAGAVMYQHTSTQASALLGQRGSSDYLNPNVNFAISPRHQLTFNYTFTRTLGGLKIGDQSLGQRRDVVLSSQLTSRLGNSAQVTFGALSDPLQLNSSAQFSVRNSVNLRLGGHTLFFSFSQDRTDASLVNRLNQQISLLSPALQELFLLDPVGFVQSPALAPELRTLLGNLQPSNTQISVSGQFEAFHRLNISPMVGYFHSDQGLAQRSDTHMLGYSLSYQLTRGLRLESSLTNVFLLDSTLHGVRRNTVLTVGLTKSLNALPHWLLPSHGRRGVIRGRVFRDLKVNGAYHAGEPGLAGLRVELRPEGTAVTDEQGRFEFTRLLPGVYEVSLPFSQFAERVRATTPTAVRVDLTSKRFAEVNIGIVSSSRVMGNVYNDYLINGERQPDAPSMRSVRLKLAGEHGTRETTADLGGDYEFDELTAGDYQLSVDASTLPADFVAPPETDGLRVEPASTVVKDIPLRALRTISGRILFKRAEGDPRPLAGVRLGVGNVIATTDAEGNFRVRNLPAGRLAVQVLATSALPDGLQLPSGQVELSREPANIRDAVIVISNAELLPYIQQEVHAPRRAGY